MHTYIRSVSFVGSKLRFVQRILVTIARQVCIDAGGPGKHGNHILQKLSVLKSERLLFNYLIIKFFCNCIVLLKMF